MPKNKPTSAVKKPKRAPAQSSAGKVSIPPAGGIVKRIQTQIAAFRATDSSLPNDRVHLHHSATAVSKQIGKKLWTSKGTVGDLYRSYKNSPHHPSSLLLKYIVHRINHLDAYDDPRAVGDLDDEFLEHHRQGDAALKNGHVQKQDLHEWLGRNPQLPGRLVQHRKHLHSLIRAGIGLNVRKINGRDYIALARGLTSKVMRDEHALASYTDNAATASSFAGSHGHVHHVWVPLEDLWYSYDMGPEYPRGEHGSENEYLVAYRPDRPRYAADPGDVKQGRARALAPTIYDARSSAGDRYIEFLTMDGHVLVPPRMGATGFPTRTTTRALLAPILDNATEEEIIEGLKFHSAMNFLPDSDPLRLWEIRSGGAIPSKVLAHIVAHYGGALPHYKLASPYVPREYARAALDDGRAVGSAVANPNLTADDLHHALDLHGAAREFPHHTIIRHPAADASVIQHAYDAARGAPNSVLVGDAVMESPKAPPALVDEVLDQSVSSIEASYAQAHSRTREQLDKLYSMSTSLGGHWLQHYFQKAPATSEQWKTHLAGASSPPVVRARNEITDKTVSTAHTLPADIRDTLARSWRFVDAFSERSDLTPQEVNTVAQTVLNGDGWNEYPDDTYDKRDLRRWAAKTLLTHHSESLSSEDLVALLKTCFPDLSADDLSSRDWWRAYDTLQRGDAPPHLLQDVERMMESSMMDDGDDGTDVEGHIVRPLPYQDMSKAEDSVATSPKPLTHAEVGQKIRSQLASAKLIHTRTKPLHPGTLHPLIHETSAGKLYPPSLAPDTLVQDSLDRIVGGQATPELLYRNYKHTPHSVPSLLLKYVVHRINNVPKYDNGSDVDADAAFLKLHQLGDAAMANGHIRPAHLHHMLWRNPDLPAQVLHTRDVLHSLVRAGVGLNTRMINGEMHVALTRGLSSNAMRDEHALSSFADIPNTGFGSFMHHAWVPLKDLWFAFPAAHEDVVGDMGHENEFLVSNSAPRYQADKDDVTRSLLSKRAEHFAPPDDWWPLTGAVDVSGTMHGMMPLAAFHAHALDSSTDDEIARSIHAKLADRLDPALLGRLRYGPNAGPKTWNVIQQHAPPLSVLGLPFAPREDAMAAFRKPTQQDRSQLIPAVLGNPNLNDNDLAELLSDPDVTGVRATLYRIADHPGYGDLSSHLLFDILHGPQMGGGSFLEHARLTTPVLDRYLKTHFLNDSSPFPDSIRRVIETLRLNGTSHTPDHVGGVLDKIRSLPDDGRVQHDTANRLYTFAKLPATEIRRLWENADGWSRDARRMWLKYNPHVPESDLLRASRSNFGTETMSALRERLSAVPPNPVLQRALWERAKEALSAPDVRPGIAREAMDTVEMLVDSDRDGALRIEPTLAEDIVQSFHDPHIHWDGRHAAILRRMLHVVPTQTLKMAAAPALRNDLDNLARYNMQTTDDQATNLVVGELRKRMSPPGHMLLPLPPDSLAKAEPSDAEMAQAISMLGGDRELALDAARFLVGDVQPKSDALRKHESDPIAGALYAFGIADTADARRTLTGLVGLEKSEGLPIATAPRVRAAFESSDTVATEIARAFRRGGVKTVALNGKHSKGSLLAKDPDTSDLFLLKPGSGSQSPAAGARDETATQSEREVAFFRIADVWGIGNQMPRADLILINDKQYAAIHMLPLSFKNFGSYVKGDTAIARRVLEKYRSSGMLHKWAVLDYVLGQTDRHSENMMIGSREHDRQEPEDMIVKLIDAGSAFAGERFDPAGDNDTFIPYYLRAWTDKPFSEMSPDDRVRNMPRAGHAEPDLRAWAQSLAPTKVRAICTLFKIDPDPSLARLAEIQGAVDGRLDETVNALWSGVA